MIIGPQAAGLEALAGPAALLAAVATVVGAVLQGWLGTALIAVHGLSR